MSAPTQSATERPLDLSRWRRVPLILCVLGGLGVLGGALTPSAELKKQFIYSYLQAFMLFLSLGLGAWFMVLLHHLFDASWSVPIRRFLEHLAYLLPVMAALFVPIALMAQTIYPWMNIDPAHDHALHAKEPLFNQRMFYAVAAICFGLWWLFTNRLRYWSLQQDQTGAAKCTFRMRRWSAVGIFVFALSLTLAAIMWMKSIQHQWFSTMYGVYYFAGSVWMTIATAYVLAVIFKRTGHLREVVHEEQFYFLGSMLLAFTVFYAYIHFSQYFIIWNANIPEETFWYVAREKGTWRDIGLVIIFGHFFVPFLALLRIDAKLTLPVMIPLCIWAWLMRFCDLSFNIMPVLHPDGFKLHWLDLACLAFMGGALSMVFLAFFNRHPAYPQKDPRFAEMLGVFVPPVSAPLEPPPGTSPAKGAK